MTLTPFSLFLLIAAGQALFFAVALLSRRAHFRGERWLASIMALLAVELGSTFYYESGLYRDWPALIGVEAATEYLYGPLLWLFIRRVAGERRLRPLQLLPHLLPFLILHLLTRIAVAQMPTGELIDLIQQERRHAPETWEFDAFTLGMLVQAACYLWRAWLCLWRYQARLEQEYANPQASTLSLFKTVLWSFDLLWLAALIVSQFAPLFGWGGDDIEILNSALALVVFALGVALLRQPPPKLVLVSPPTEPPPQVETPVAETDAASSRKYARSALDDSAALLLFEELDARMRTEAIWKDADLDLAGLAERTGWSPHYLSQAINCGAGCNFNDYINRYRVQAVQQRLASLAEHETVLGLALEAGFNSKSAFYTAFKRHTGLTPKAFQQQHLSIA